MNYDGRLSYLRRRRMVLALAYERIDLDLECMVAESGYAE